MSSDNVPCLAAQDQGAGYGAQELDELVGEALFVFEGKEVEEGGGVDDVHVSFEFRKSFPLIAIPVAKDITTEEFGLYPIPVLEELVAEISVLRAEICAVEIRGGSACSNKRADVLPEAAAEIEKGVGILETRDHGVEERVDGYGKIEEAELADARVRVNGPCAVTLVRKRNVSLLGSTWGWGIVCFGWCSGRIEKMQEMQ